MIRTLKFGNKEVKLSNSIAWTIIYRDQFGHDIVSTLTPMLAAVLDLTSGFFANYEDGETVKATDIIQRLDGDALIDALAHLSGLEFVDLINITWAMAKALDRNLPEPIQWVSQFDEFPVDVIAPEVAKLAFKGMVSKKNFKRVMDLRKKIKISHPLNSTPSSSQESSED